MRPSPPYDEAWPVNSAYGHCTWCGTSFVNYIPVEIAGELQPPPGRGWLEGSCEAPHCGGVWLEVSPP